jgi:hypothetical protein
MAIEMSDISKIVLDEFEQNGLDYTIDNRIEVLAGLAKNVAAIEEVDPLERTHLSLMITLEIVRLRVEKEMFGL